MAQILAPKVQPGHHRRIHQCFIVGLGPVGLGAILNSAIQRAGAVPSTGEAGAGAHPDLAHIIACGIEAHPVPLQIDDLVGHRDASGDGRLGCAQGRGVDEFGHHLPGAGGQIEVEGVNFHRIAPPANRLAICQKMHVHQLFNGPHRRVVPGNPLWQLQDQRIGAGRQRNGLGHTKGGVGGVGGIHIQDNWPAGPWCIHCIGHSVVKGRSTGRSTGRGTGRRSGCLRDSRPYKGQPQRESQRGAGPEKFRDHGAVMA